MLLKSGEPYSAHYCIHDCAGTKIPYVYSFDTVTKEIELLVNIGKDASGVSIFLREIDPVGVNCPLHVKTM